MFAKKWDSLDQAWSAQVGVACCERIRYLRVLGPEGVLALHVDVVKVVLPDQSGQRVQLAPELGDDGEDPGQPVIQEVVVVRPAAEGVERQPVKVSAFVLGHADDRGDLVELARLQEPLGVFRKDLPVHHRPRSPREREERLEAKQTYRLLERS